MNVMYEQSYPHFYEQQQQLFISSFNCKPHIVTNSHRREDMYKKDLVCPIDKYSFAKQGKGRKNTTLTNGVKKSQAFILPF